MEAEYLYSSKIVCSEPLRIVEPLSWVGHIPFAHWLVQNCRPATVVELGTHTGNSYFAFCQAVRENAVASRCCAIDTWQGDEQAGYYGDEIYLSVKEHNERHYGSFSRLLRMTFDDAISHFSDGSIDCLHIDGLHTYEAVRHDFESWLPKSSGRGVVLFHDTSVREEGFGVWRLWEEISPRFPHVHFDHSHGLGVLFVGEEQPPAVHALLKGWESAEGRGNIRGFFSRLGALLECEWLSANHRLILAERERLLAECYQHLAERDQQIAAVADTYSWRITAPLRWLGQKVLPRR